MQICSIWDETPVPLGLVAGHRCRYPGHLGNLDHRTESYRQAPSVPSIPTARHRFQARLAMPFHGHRVRLLWGPADTWASTPPHGRCVSCWAQTPLAANPWRVPREKDDGLNLRQLYIRKQSLVAHQRFRNPVVRESIVVDILENVGRTQGAHDPCCVSITELAKTTDLRC